MPEARQGRGVVRAVPIAYAAQFDGSTQYLSCASNSTLQAGASHFALLFWAYWDSLPANAYLFAKNVGDNSDQAEFYVKSETTNFLFQVQNGALAGEKKITTASGAAATWKFYACWWDGTNINVSINNGATASLAFSAGLNVTTQAFSVGARSNGTNPFPGRIDNALWYKGGFPATAERTSIYNGGQGKSFRHLTAAEKTSLVSAWDADETGGTRKDLLGTNDLLDTGGVTRGIGKVVI